MLAAASAWRMACAIAGAPGVSEWTQTVSAVTRCGYAAVDGRDGPF